MANIVHSKNLLKSSNRETGSINKLVGIIRSDQSEMKVSQARWDCIFHRATDCPGAKRPTGCLVCEHDTENCKIKNCALCQKKKNLPFEEGVVYNYPEE